MIVELFKTVFIKNGSILKIKQASYEVLTECLFYFKDPYMTIIYEKNNVQMSPQFLSSGEAESRKRLSELAPARPRAEMGLP